MWKVSKRGDDSIVVSGGATRGYNNRIFSFYKTSDAINFIDGGMRCDVQSLARLHVTHFECR